MTNSLENIIPKIVSRGMLSFREQAIMPRLVNANFSADAARKGDKIEVLMPGEVEVEDVIPSPENPVVPDFDVKTETIELNNWKKVSFYLTDQEMVQVETNESFIPFAMNEAVRALAEEVNRSFYKEIMRARHLIGYPGKELFTQNPAEKDEAYAGINPALEGRKLLNSSRAPKSGRFAIIGFEEEAKALTLPEFADAERSGDTSVRLEGEIGRKYGIQWFSTDQIHKHIATKSADFNPSFVLEKGDLYGQIRNYSLPPAFGDLITDTSGKIMFGIDNLQRKVTSSSSVYNMSLPIQQRLTSGTRIRFGPDHHNHMIFQRDAFAFAMRPLTSANEIMGLGNRIMSVTDPETGLSMRLEISRQHKRTVWEFDVLWGVKLVKPEFAIRVIT